MSKLYFSSPGIEVTESRIAIGPTVYAMRQVNRVAMHKFERRWIGSGILLIIGAVLAIASQGENPLLLIGLLFVAGGIAYAYLTGDQYSLTIGMSSGEISIMYSRKPETILPVADAIAKAINEQRP